MTKFTIGCDPEIFVKDSKGAVSAHNMVPGTKKEPAKVEEGMIQVDGMALEFGIDPIDLLNENVYNGLVMRDLFSKRVGKVVGILKAEAKKTNPNVVFNISPVQDFSEEVMSAAPEEAKELGCDPDYNAYTLEPNPRPDGTAVNFRTASGHIHIGWGADIPVDHPDHMKICADFVKVMDVFVGLFMTIIDYDPRRRILYGKAGAFRPKSYGVEYRTPSNMWLTTNARRKMIYTLTSYAVTFHRQGYTILSQTGMRPEDIQTFINNGDYRAAYDTLMYVFDRLGWRTQLLTQEFNARVKHEASTAVATAA